jgi:anti-sigma B factor antagonist
MGTAMNLQTSTEQQVLVILPSEDFLDASNVKAFREGMLPLLQQNKKVLLDMSGLRFVDSAGVGALISCLRVSGEAEADFRLSGLSRPVRALFDLMRMHKVFHIHNDKAEAIAAMTVA